METVIEYFETIPSLHRSTILVGGLSFFWIVESYFPYLIFSMKNGGMRFQIFFLQHQRY